MKLAELAAESIAAIESEALTLGDRARADVERGAEIAKVALSDLLCGNIDADAFEAILGDILNAQKMGAVAGAWGVRATLIQSAWSTVAVVGKLAGLPT